MIRFTSIRVKLHQILKTGKAGVVQESLIYNLKFLFSYKDIIYYLY